MNRDIILNQTFVAIDPSCASQSSKPGYAIYQAGKFVEGGVIDVKYKPSLPFRLQSIRELIAREIAPHVQMLVIEDVPVRPIKTASGIQMNFQAISSLKMACGATIAAFGIGVPVIQMPANLWTRLAHNAGIVWEKSDDKDAQLIGWATIQLAQSGDE